MGCIGNTFIFFFLLVAFGTEAISFLIGYMVSNRRAPGLHDGIFYRCGAISYFQNAINSFGNFLTSQLSLDERVLPFSGCYWWNSDLFPKDEKSLQACVVLAFVSIATVALIVLFYLIRLIDRFKSRSLNVFISILLIFNTVVLTSIILIYSFVYARDATVSPDGPELIYSWSYWLLYVSASCCFITSFLFCCLPSKKNYYR